MAVDIFHTESGNTEEWLTVNDDGTVTHHRENTGWRMGRRAMEASNSTMTAEEAKRIWCFYAEDIEKALAQIAAEARKEGRAT